MITVGKVILYTGLASAAVVADFSRNVVRVFDGDTIEVLHNTHPERVRLSGIDCPEKGHAFGKRAKQAASLLVFGRDVIFQTHGQDKYGRTLEDVLLPDGTNVNHELVKNRPITTVT
jgi:endonuclease YncB( thermonuclease family)